MGHSNPVIYEHFKLCGKKAETISTVTAFFLPSLKGISDTLKRQDTLHFLHTVRKPGNVLISPSLHPLPKAIGFCGGNLGGGGLGGTWDGFAGLSDIGHLLIVP